MRRLLLLSVLTLTCGGASYAAELELGVPRLAPAPYAKSTPSIASNGESYFAVWTDARRGTSAEKMIVGCRMATGGEPLDPSGIIISTHGMDPASVVAAGGGNYLVAWQKDDQIALSRIAPDGRLLDPAPKLPLSRPSYFSSIAAGGSVVAFLVVDQVVLVNANADVLEKIALRSPDAGEYAWRHLLAWDGRAFVLVQMFFRKSDNLGHAHVSMIRPDGSVESSFETPPTLPQATFALAALPDRILLVGKRLEKTPLVRWIFDGAGSPIGRPVEFAGAHGTPRAVQLAVDDDSFLASWTEGSGNSTIRLARITRQGDMSDAVGFSGGVGDASGAIVTTAGPSALTVAWTRCAEVTQCEVVAQRMSDSLQPMGAERILSNSATSQRAPLVTSNGREILASWIDTGPGGRSIVARRFSDAGPIDASEFVVAAAIPESLRPQLSVASDGKDFAITWHANGRLFLRRLSARDGWLDAEARLVATDVSYFSSQALAWNGSNYLLVFSRSFEWDSAPVGVIGLPIARNGDAGAELFVSPQPSLTADATVVRAGDGWLVSWIATPKPWGDCNACMVPGMGDVEAARVTAAGAVIDPAPLELGTYSHGPDFEYANRLFAAASGDSALVTWSMGASYVLRGTRVFFDGRIEAGDDHRGALLAAGSRPLGPISSDGHDFMLFDADAFSLYRIPGSGALEVLGTPEEIRDGPGKGVAIDGAICASPTSSFIAYGRLAFGPQYGGVNRVFGRTIQQRARAIRR